jgi:thioredoxin reductase/Pyruvate/2-oxoacid:ferredoxin oxidoreductase delta subunit
MTFTLLLLLAVGLSMTLAVLLLRRLEVRNIESRLEERSKARQTGSHHARLLYPHVDLSRCIGCGTCVAACPEEGVLELIHGQALVVHGARCVGHGRCAAECPVGGIALTLGDLEGRKDIPVVGPGNESETKPGLFLAGEITGFALVRTALEHGREVAAEVARRVNNSIGPQGGGLDLCIVGAGPAGIACALEAKKQGLRFVMLEQDSLGGSVSKYPRRKLVMTHPIDLPLSGSLDKDSYSKEELIEKWESIVAEQNLPLEIGHRFTELETTADGSFEVKTSGGSFHANHVCLAFGRRGTPRKLGVHGEDLSKVHYSLIDAHSFQNRHLLVVGGGDSAIEAAMGLAEQPGNTVTLSYRKHAFFRIKARNEARLQGCLAEGSLEVVFNSQVESIADQEVLLQVSREDSNVQRIALRNDEVFIMVGGIPPFPLLEQAGFSFDHAGREAVQELQERGTGLLPALAFGLLATLAALFWAYLHSDYYRLSNVQRPAHELHALLRPSRAFGLGAGIIGAALILMNLCYLLRRAPNGPIRFGSLQAWMTSHVATGLFALIAAMLHSAFRPQDTVGGHAFWGLVFLICTGAIGRYLYSFIPHSANGRELELEEIRAEMATLASAWDRDNRDFGHRVQDQMNDLIRSGRWNGNLLIRIVSLVRQQRELRKSLRTLGREGRAEGIAEDQVQRVLDLARRAHWAALMATRFEEMRGILASWRYFHRWVALLMVLLLGVHIVSALRFSSIT